ncbi:thioesterase [Sinomonas cyclohexanicum]|uniref:Thioesterase n=1 Tax=Sinomonas cyclohexanicum TaxID=322009 RepID=A0ABM7PUC9_SINCY|nr:thioesterase family protein [Corynebacterium cyclohexanicum]BCT75859.1 thioesterase [Corynebacterium cyclohexanicum]
MHLLLRTLVLLITSRRRPPLSIWGTSSLALRVLPTDIDIALHVNNGMYFSLMDLGRFDLMVRARVWDRIRARGWSPVVNLETITFRKSLQLWQAYTIESKIIGFDEKAIFFEQRMVADGEVYARAYIATRLVSKGGPVANEEIFEEMGQPPVDLVLPEFLHAWREENALPSTRRPAPHVW